MDLLAGDIFAAAIAACVVTFVVGAVAFLLNPKSNDWKFTEYAFVFLIAFLLIWSFTLFHSTVGDPWSTINKSLNGV